ncbi:patatin-like phospholipase family protein [Paenibacillus sp. Soil522]|uniref:patatin-like phospholipase family protein n=1 Tax=Paenibacillus sp. Soil522 TaxID=1736388 RepID=UPI000AF658A9|nr:patatin-like phospholipase family protein [Paenibacillus sp. Soil522]
MTVAIVLSGGGAKGDFQVGAVRYLYENNIRPAILTGCSVGAINAIKLSEGEGDGSDATRGLSGLIGIWRELRSNSDMWEKEAWLTGIENSEVLAFLEQSAASQVGTVALEAGKIALGPIGWAWVAYDLINTVNDIQELKRELEKIINARSRSLYNLGPILGKLNNPAKLDLNKVRQSGITLRLAAVALESGALRYVTETGVVLERDNMTPLMAPPPDIAPECRSLANEIDDRKEERTRLQADLHHASGSERAEILAQIKEINERINELDVKLNQCKIDNPPQPGPLRVSLIQGTLASAAIPFAFPPVKLGSENYVDGGVREIAPIQVAIQSGATDVYAVLASDSTVDPARSVASGELLQSFDVGVATIADVASRAASDIMTNETVLNEAEPPLGWGANVTLIQPDFDIHDIMTIDPGLIDIRIAHGYMRADDTLQARQQNNTADYRKLADELSEQRHTGRIVVKRKEIWEKEYAATGFLLQYDANGRPVHPAQAAAADPQALQEVRNLKNELRDLVHDRQLMGGAVPSECESWWLDWERHPWQPAKVLWLPSGPAASGDDMQPGEVLEADRLINSANGWYTFVFQSDGNLVLYKNYKDRDRKALWASNTVGQAGVCIMQGDGNLVIYDPDGVPRWSSDTWQYPGSRLIVQDDGNAVIYRPDGTAVWATNTVQATLPSGPAAAGDDMQPGELLEMDRPIHSANGWYTFVFQGDGNLVLYKNYRDRDRRWLWDSATGDPVGVCIMQGDGNLVVYDADGVPRWSSGTWQHPGSRLVVQDDGNAVIYRPDGTAVWATNTVQAMLPSGTAAAGDDMQPGELLDVNHPVQSANGRYTFVFQGDGNLVLYINNSNGDRSWLWDSATGGPVGVCIMQGDGNLVIYDENAVPRWSSDTWQHPGSRLVVQDDGNVVIYRPDGTAVWATDTVQS